MEEIEKLISSHLGKAPVIGQNVYVADGAIILGDVTIGDNSSIWFNAVIRGDVGKISIGSFTNIQDGSIIHISENIPCIIGDYVTIGHHAVIHSCTIKNEVLIGMNATVLDNAEIGKNCIIGANALIPPGAKIPDGSLALGIPAKVVRKLNEAEIQGLKAHATKYSILANYHANNKK
jgi:carbonic anhydrase/acetyltransferase-like protein (isoleucine patch superfamily)